MGRVAQSGTPNTQKNMENARMADVPRTRYDYQ